MTTRTWKQGLLAVPGVGVSLLPKLLCPACWPAYAGLLSSRGLGFLISTRYLFPLTTIFLSMAAASLAFRASRRRGLGPFWIGLGATVLVLIGKFYFESMPTTYAGVGLLVMASIWNAGPSRSQSGLCPACIPAEDGFVRNGDRKGEVQS